MTRPSIAPNGEGTKTYTVRVRNSMFEILRKAGSQKARDALRSIPDGYWIDGMTSALEGIMVQASKISGLSIPVLLRRAVVAYTKARCPQHDVDLNDQGRCVICIQEASQ